MASFNYICSNNDCCYHELILQYTDAENYVCACCRVIVNIDDNAEKTCEHCNGAELYLWQGPSFCPKCACKMVQNYDLIEKLEQNARASPHLVLMRDRPF
tara:strand:- start:120 stop:419 length:300 start_codon:yes stop_codon:yes gene_type:complete